MNSSSRSRCGSAGIGTIAHVHHATWLPRLHRAGPSASLDEQVSSGVIHLAAMIPQLGDNVKPMSSYSMCRSDSAAASPFRGSFAGSTTPGASQRHTYRRCTGHPLGWSPLPSGSRGLWGGCQKVAPSWDMLSRIPASCGAWPRSQPGPWPPSMSGRSCHRS
jgi:hypothetical protein